MTCKHASGDPNCGKTVGGTAYYATLQRERQDAVREIEAKLIHVTVDHEALARVLGPHEVVERMERGAVKGSARPSTNDAVIWRYFTTSVYRSGDLPSLATREALQNGLDACRARFGGSGKQLRGGQFSVTWDAQKRALTWEDNGIGMDLPTLQGKFLRLGESGKNLAGDSSQAAGGFGVAKAVILGTSSTFRWEIHSRDNLIVSNGVDPESPVYDAPFLQGTRITIFDVSKEFDRHYEHARDTYVDMAERLRDVLAANDLDGMTLKFNGAEVPRMFSRRAGAVVATGGSWGDGVTAAVKAYRRPPGDKHGAYYIRIGGLFQFSAPSRRGSLKADVVVDLTSTIRPGERGYPLNAARDALQDRARWAFDDLSEEVERENESTGHDREYEIYDPESDEADERDGASEIAKETQAAFEDPDFMAAIADAAGGLRDYRSAQESTARGIAKPSSNAPAGSRSDDNVPDGMLLDAPAADAAGLVEGSTKAAATVVRTMLQQADAAAARAQGFEAGVGGGIITAEVTDVLDRAERGGHVDYNDGRTLNAALDRATDAAVSPGGGGLLQAASIAQLGKPMRVLLPSGMRPPNPFGKLAGLRISKKNYDRQKARRFRKGIGKWMPLLTAWDATLRLVAAEARIRRKFKPGFVLDDTLMAYASVGAGGAVLHIHPDRFAQAIKVHKDRPLALAAFLHGSACHELTHLDGRMGDGHSEDFTSAREDMGAATAHLLPAISILITRVLKLTVRESPELKQIRGLERRLAKAKEELAQRAHADVDALGDALRVCQSKVLSCSRDLTAARAETAAAIEAARAEAFTACNCAAPSTGNRADEFLDGLVQALRQNPPPGVSRAYVDGFIQRNRERLVLAVSPLVDAF